MSEFSKIRPQTLLSEFIYPNTNDQLLSFAAEGLVAPIGVDM